VRGVVEDNVVEEEAGVNLCPFETCGLQGVDCGELDASIWEGLNVPMVSELAELMHLTSDTHSRPYVKALQIFGTKRFVVLDRLAASMRFASGVLSTVFMTESTAQILLSSKSSTSDFVFE
jgi:hypothetical protein